LASDVEICQRIKLIISNVTSIPAEEISDEASFRDDLDLDSLSVLEISVDTDYAFQLGLPEEDWQTVESLPQAVALVRSTVEQKAAAQKTAAQASA
jgi:acyl carrier protein